MEAFTVRRVVKDVAAFAIQRQASAFVETAIINHTRHEEDDFIVDLGANLVGGYVASLLKPWSDRVVDRAADLVNEKRVARAAKKTEKSEEK